METGRGQVHGGAASDVGKVRRVNQDACLVAPPVLVVADGMGGHAAGEVASRIVVETFDALAGSRHDLRSGAQAVVGTLAECQRRILEYSSAQGQGAPSRWYAGTTAVVALLVEEDGSPRWLVANLGDSRAYLLDGGRLAQVTVDHSLVQQLLDAGEIRAEEVATHPERHVVTRALGGPHAPEPDLFLLPATGRLLLCSDGVTGMLSDERLAELLASTRDPQQTADLVVEAAVAAGGIDNATAVVADVVGWAPPQEDDGTREASR
ncbi:MAG TPA: protein phosphatase 2C domain-containing protein [Nocardioides sp.]|uniref:PP2C family protein-serine/threonine phosphatase n=1 Tax=Nocardioides sp. TaxID=35761 RepID=UPI002B54D4D2|nr:protein phosphatase 2C domain-containing protein [Nocardioides sp.]HQR27937.1 protein phosphatase 2C domain-containing protein [Nocardioides sp.]